MITSVHIENFKCFKDFDIELGPFNVLIGPNDSGKTAFLQALALQARTPLRGSASWASYEGVVGVSTGQDVVWRNDVSKVVEIVVKAGVAPGKPDWPEYRIHAERDSLKSGVVGQAPDELALKQWQARTGDWERDWYDTAIGKVAFYQFEPNALRKPSRLHAVMGRTGEGFPTFLDDINREDRQVFGELERHFYDRFPYYSNIIIDKATFGKSDAFVLKFHTIHGEILPAEAVSDGLMLSLAFIALSHSPDPPKILLVEEPEAGVHHANLKEIVGTLRYLSKNRGVQVVLTTHSPYLLDRVEPEEVRLFTKDEEGAVHATKMSDAPDVAELRKHFMTGEIWTVETEDQLANKAQGEQ